MRLKNSFLWLSIICGLLVLSFILFPLLRLVSGPSPERMSEAIHDINVRRAIWLSIYTAGLAALISLLLGTPLAYLLARRQFPGKSLLESIIDLPIVIPHPVVGIAILGVVGKNFWLGRLLHEIGIRMMGSVTGIVTVLVFVAIPFYINAAKNGFESVPPRLENVSRSLGASFPATFFRITLPLASRSILTGFIMSMARALSEFGAVIVIAYHPMIAPVMIYERFESYGLEYSQPVAVLLILICLALFLALRVLTANRKKRSRGNFGI